MMRENKKRRLEACGWRVGSTEDFLGLSPEESMKVKILCGISGSGKSTYIKNHFPDADVCSADHFFMKDGEYKFDPAKLSKAHGECLKHFVYLMSTKPHGDRIPVVVDNTNTTVVEIAPYAALALAYGCDLEIIILEAPLEKAAARNQHGVPRDAVEGQHKRLKTLADQLPRWWPVVKVPAEGL
jgi:predicted kinase